jgi:ribonuclease D
MINPAYKLISTTDDLNECITHLQKQEEVYLDLEFDKNHFTYGFNLCLLQVASKHECFLIDPIGSLDMGPMFRFLEDKSIRKYTYAFGEDLRLLHHLGCMIKNVADLATARTLLNEEHVSLNSLIEDIIGKALPKSQQKSNWSKRPLTEEQLKYAAADVVYLPQISLDILNDLKLANRLQWFEDEVNFLDSTDYSESHHFITVKESEKKYYTKREWMRYIALLEFRENLAKDINRPGYRVLDKKILELLAKEPNQLDKWPNFKMNVHPKIRHRNTKHKIQQLFKELEQEFEALNISKDQPAREQLSKIEKIQRSEQRTEFNRKKENYFQPLKEKIRENYGENIANYLLSNRMVTRYFYEGIEPMPYQKRIFDELGN